METQRLLKQIIDRSIVFSKVDKIDEAQVVVLMDPDHNKDFSRFFGSVVSYYKIENESVVLVEGASDKTPTAQNCARIDAVGRKGIPVFAWGDPKAEGLIREFSIGSDQILQNDLLNQAQKNHLINESKKRVYHQVFPLDQKSLISTLPTFLDRKRVFVYMGADHVQLDTTLFKDLVGEFLKLLSTLKYVCLDPSRLVDSDLALLNNKV